MIFNDRISLLEFHKNLLISSNIIREDIQQTELINVPLQNIGKQLFIITYVVYKNF